MNFTVEYEPTPDEIVRAYEQSVMRQSKRLRLAAPVILALCGVVFLLTGDTGLGIGALVAAVLFPLMVTWSIRRTMSRYVSLYCVPTTFHMTSDGYEYRTDQMSTTMRWSMFDEVVTNTEFWLFFKNKQPVAFLPRRAFTSAQQTDLDTVLSSSSALKSKH